MSKKFLVSHVLTGNQHEGPYEVEILLYQCIDWTSVYDHSLVWLGFLVCCSQELLEAVEEERNVQENHARTKTIFRYPLIVCLKIMRCGTCWYSFRECASSNDKWWHDFEVWRKIYSTFYLVQLLPYWFTCELWGWRGERAGQGVRCEMVMFGRRGWGRGILTFQGKWWPTGGIASAGRLHNMSPVYGVPAFSKPSSHRHVSPALQYLSKPNSWCFLTLLSAQYWETGSHKREQGAE